MHDLRRRELIILLGAAAAASWPVAVRGQQSRMPVVGFLSARSSDESASHVAFFQRGLNEVGYVEGHNVAIDYRWADGRYDRLPELASDLVARRVSVLAAVADPAPQVAKAATRTTPIVFAINGDPVRDGLVASLNRPGGNATGVTIFGPDAVTKRLQLLLELAPQAAAIAYVMNPNNPKGNVEMSAAQAAARSLRKEMLVLSAGNERELDDVFATADRRRIRSEERRVGKECRWRWSPDHEKRKEAPIGEHVARQRIRAVVGGERQAVAPEAPVAGSELGRGLRHDAPLGAVAIVPVDTERVDTH